MQLSLLAIVFAAACSAAPHVQNGHQNRRHQRRALLHEDMLALYVQPSSTVTSSAALATSTGSSSGAHGPYAAGELHGGNTNAAKAVAEVSATSSDAAAATTDSTWTIASASRNITMFSHSYAYNATDSDSDDSSDGSNGLSSDSDDEALEDDSSDSTPSSKASGVPSWAIALVTIFAVLSASGLVAFFFLRHKKSLNKDASVEKEDPTTDEDDALSSYKAFWELKRQSAGSFVSADATPAAVASDSIATSILRTDSLPLYEARDNAANLSNPATPAETPSSERAPPRGFLYQ